MFGEGCALTLHAIPRAFSDHPHPTPSASVAAWHAPTWIAFWRRWGARGAPTEGEPADLVGAINSSMQQAISSMQQLRASVGQAGHGHGHRGAR